MSRCLGAGPLRVLAAVASGSLAACFRYVWSPRPFIVQRVSRRAPNAAIEVKGASGPAAALAAGSEIETAAVASALSTGGEAEAKNEHASAPASSAENKTEVAADPVDVAKHKLRQSSTTLSPLNGAVEVKGASGPAAAPAAGSEFDTELSASEAEAKNEHVSAPANVAKNETEAAADPVDYAKHKMRQSSTTSSPVQKARLNNEFLDNFIVVPEAPLLFCFIEKVGSTQFQRLFQQVTHRKGVGGSFFKANSPKNHRLKTRDLERMMINKTWHKAVFYREPLERFLSAYNSKCGAKWPKHGDRDGPKHCFQEFHKFPISFSDAVTRMGESEPRNRSWGRHNEHFVEQARFCGGLKDTLQFYDTIEQLDVTSANRKVKQLLAKVNISDVQTPGYIPGRFEWQSVDGIFPMTGVSGHSTNTSEKVLRSYGDVESLAVERLRDFYKIDYELFGIDTPDWAEALIQKKSVTGGRYLSSWPLF